MVAGQRGKMIKVGIIGINEGNGHPYSFSCIINGFDKLGLKESGWDVIYNYIRQQDSADLGFNGVEVTHIWTQDFNESKRISRAARIPNIVINYTDMIGKIDALIIARDDFDQHYNMAKPFLEAGCFVFIDKPLSLSIEELRFFKPYLDQGRLMSCSGMHYSSELDYFRENTEDYGQIKLIRGTVLNNIEKYGIHMLDAAFGSIPFQVESVLCINSPFDSAVLFNKDRSLFQLDALGETVKTFQFDVFGEKGRFHAELTNNFSAFRRTLFHFFEMVKYEKPVIEPTLTISIMKVLIAFSLSKKENRLVKLEEIYV
jgi:hypothetical protein